MTIILALEEVSGAGAATAEFVSRTATVYNATATAVYAASADFVTRTATCYNASVTVSVTPDFISRTPTLYNASTSATYTATANFVSRTATVYTSTASAAYAATANYVSRSATTYTATGSAAYSASANYGARSPTAYNPTASATYTASANFVSRSATVYEATATAGSSAEANFVSRSSSLYNATASAVASASANFVSRSATVYEATASALAPGAATAEFVSRSATVYQGTASAAYSASANLVSRSATPYNPTASAAYSASANMVSRTATVYQASGAESGSTIEVFYTTPGVLTGASGDGYIFTNGHSYTDAREYTGDATMDVSSTSVGIGAGQYYVLSHYLCYESFLRFDTSSIPDDATITSVTLSLAVLSDESTTDFTIEARSTDMGDGLGGEDWVDGSALSGLTLLASKSTSGGLSLTDYIDLTSETAFLSAINQTGSTDIIVTSSRQRTGDTPTGLERVIFVPSEATGWPAWQRDYATSYSPGTDGTATVTTPNSVVADDILFVIVIYNCPNDVGTIDTPAGYTEISQGTYQNSSVVDSGRAALFWKRATADDAGDVVSVTTTGGDTGDDTVVYAHMFVYDGLLESGVPYEECAAKYDGNGSTTITWDAVTVTDYRTLAAFSVQADDATPTTPTYYSSAYAMSTTVGTDANVADFYRYAQSSGPSVTTSGGQTEGWATWHLSLIPQGYAPRLTVTYTIPSAWTDMSIVINDDAASTNDNDVTLTISAQCDGADPEEMCFSDDGASWGAWVSYATSYPYQLPAQSDEAAHDCTVYVKFRTDAEESSSVNDSISLQVIWSDELVEINGGLWYAGATEVPVVVRGLSSAGEVTDYALSVDSGAYGAWTDYLLNYAHPVLGGSACRFLHDFTTEGEHALAVKLKDDDGNTLVIGTETINIMLPEDIVRAEIVDVLPVRCPPQSVRYMEAMDTIPVRCDDEPQRTAQNIPTRTTPDIKKIRNYQP